MPTVKWTSEDAEVQRKIAALEAKLGRVQQKTEAVGRTGKKSSDEMVTGLGRVGGMVKGVVAGYVGWQVLIGTLKQAHKEFIQEMTRGAQRLEMAFDPMKQIRQISESVEDFRAKRKLIQETAAAEGLPEVTTAGMYFAALSGGVADQWQGIVKGARFLEPAAAAEAIATFRSRQIFGPEVAGTGEQILSKLTRAAKESKFNVAGMIQAALLTAPEAGRLGGGPLIDEELLALLSTTSQSFISPERGATAIRAVLAQLAEGIKVTGAGGKMEQVRFAGGGIMAGFESLRTQHPEAYQQLLDSNKEFARGAIAIERAADKVPGLTRVIARENLTLGALETQMQIYGEDVETGAVVGRRRAAERLKIAEGSRLGRLRLAREQVMDEALAAHIERTGTGLIGGMERALLRMWFGATGDPGIGITQFTTRMVSDELISLVQRIEHAVTSTDGKTRPAALQTPLGRPAADDGGDVKWN